MLRNSSKVKRFAEVAFAMCAKWAIGEASIQFFLPISRINNPNFNSYNRPAKNETTADGMSHNEA